MSVFVSFLEMVLLVIGKPVRQKGKNASMDTKKSGFPAGTVIA
jgi:hypothetical protein